jgi:hypothetical protein
MVRMRVKRLVLLAVLLFLMVVPVFAQIDVNPCGGADPDDTSSDCPIDSWVALLILTAIFLAYRQLKKEKSLAIL